MAENSIPNKSFRLSYVYSVGGQDAVGALQELFGRNASNEEVEDFVSNCQAAYGPSHSRAVGIDASTRRDRYGCSEVVIDEG